MSIPLPTFTLPPNAGTLTDAIAALRREVQAADADEQRAALLHEAGILEDKAHNEAQAARDLLSAVNERPDFLEPLERLISIIERRKSYKNLGKLLERLCKVVTDPLERARALQARASFVADHDGDFGHARELFEEAHRADPADATPLLSLELLAARLQDRGLGLRVLSERARIAHDSTWKALLWIALSQELKAEDPEGAIAALESALADGGSASDQAARALEDLAITLNRVDLLARALEARAGWIVHHLEGGIDETGVPEFMRSPEHAADILGRAASARRRAGEIDRAIGLVERSLAFLPDEATLLLARLRYAELAGDTTTAAAFARRELERGVTGPAAAALWLRVAESAAESADVDGALEALAQALSADAQCVPAWALELDLLTGSGRAPALARAYEEAARLASNPEARIRSLMVAADVWAREAGDTSSAERILAEARTHGMDPALAGRLGRCLASVVGDRAWYERASESLAGADGSIATSAGTWFEIARGRRLREDHAGARRALESLADAAGGQSVSAVLCAYGGLPGADVNAGREALRTLAGLTDEAESARAYRLVASLRALLAGDVERASLDLAELHRDNDADIVAASALATLLRRNNETARAADALAACAAAVEDPLLAAALGLEAGVLQWLSGDREGGVDRLAWAAEKAPEAGDTLHAWALRAAQPNDTDARRRALEASTGTQRSAAQALERFGLEVGSDGDAAAAASALDDIGGDPAFEAIADLVRALWSPGADTSPRKVALEALAKSSTSVAPLALSSLYQIELAALHAGEESGSEAAQTAAERWAEADAEATAALEWLSTTVRTSNRSLEVAARRRIAARLSGDCRSAMDASAALVAFLTEDAAPPPLPTAGAPAVLANLELAPPGADPRRRAAALERATDFLGKEVAPVAATLIGYNLLACGRPSEALTAFRSGLDDHPEDIALWEGVRAAAEMSGDRAVFAEACAALGDAVGDDSLGAELWERAARVLLDEFGDQSRGELALSRAVERDITRFSSFDALFRLVRARKDGKRLLELISARLEVAEDPDEIVKLFWERARVLRQAGDARGALQALDNVAMLEPDHVGALALTGEIYITEQRFEEAAGRLARLAELDEAPRQQRLMSGIAAVDLYENKVHDVERALDVLVGLHAAKLTTLPVRERLARAAARAESWGHAVSILEELMAERDTSQGRMDAARLAVAIYRNRLHAPERALGAVERLLEEAPDDGEGLDLVLSGVFEASVSKRLLERGKIATLESLVTHPMNEEGIVRLGELARVLDDPPLRQIALGAVVALGRGDAQAEQELSLLDRRMATRPQMRIDDDAVRLIRDPEDAGPIADLFAILAPTLAEALGPGLAAFGVTRKDRVRPKDGLPIRDEVAAWAGALGLGEFEFYVGGRDPQGIYGIPGEIPTVVVGTEVSAPLGPRYRAELARELLALRLGTSILRHRSLADIAAIVVATGKLGGVAIPSPTYALLSEFEREIGKQIPRRIRKTLPDLLSPIATRATDPEAWARAAIASLDRMATIAAGDVSWVLAERATERGQPPLSEEGRTRAARLLSFVFSPAFSSVRDQLGMGLR